MAYICNPVYCGVGTVDAADASALTRNAKFADTFTAVYAALERMSTAERQQVMLRVKPILDAMPYDAMENHIDTALKAARVLDPRRAAGLGVVAAAGGALSTTAQVAGIIASLTTTGFAVANFIQSRKTAKDQKETFDAQQALVKQQMQAQIEAQKRQNAAQDAALSRQDQVAQAEAQAAMLAAQGLTLDAQGNVVKKSSAGTIAAIVAAGAGAFFLAK
jgi:hypothetical protein